MSTPSPSKSKSSDILIAAGAILCIALGATVTYGLTHRKAGPAVGASSNGEVDFLPVSFATLSSYSYEIPAIDEPVAKPAAKVPAARPAKETAPNAPATEPVGSAPHKDQIPQPIKELNGKKVALQGFMVPIDLKGGKTTRFMLVRDQSLCCFGRMPRMNEWVSVTMNPEKSARVILDQPVTVFGNLKVGEVMDNGEVLSIYRLDSDDVAGPLDL